MSITVKQFSSLNKIITIDDINASETNSAIALRGEHISYQIAIKTDEQNIYLKPILEASVDSSLAEYIKIYSVKHIAADLPHPLMCDTTDYITDKPMLIPDLLVPLEKQNNYFNFVNNFAVLWVEVSIPREYKCGKEKITINITGHKNRNTAVDFEHSAEFTLDILPYVLPYQKTAYTQWMHIDCIATVHNVEIYSPAHWGLIDKYMAMASDLGINMILTPVVTPPLDTAPGTRRLCTQLVDIEKTGESYTFDFSKLRKYINMAKKNKMKYFEISHFFSQWGCEFPANIKGVENGEEKWIFGWDAPVRESSYGMFLKAFIPELIDVLSDEGIVDNCFFHISDEPDEEHLESYEYARNLLKPLIGKSKTIDALSNINFYEKGLVETPVCANNHIEPFLERKVKNLWTYYCCGQTDLVSNRFMAMPSYRNRIIGLQIYKYGIEGFLQWGFNFYYSQFSLYTINPYVTTSTDGVFSSGDPFSVYPGDDGPMPSLRALVFREALEDIEVCRLLEEKIGKEAVVKLIEEEAGMEITFKEYPLNIEFIPRLMTKMKKML